MEHVKEYLEALKALEATYDGYKKIMEDDKIDYKDIQHVPELLIAWRTGVEGIKKVPSDLQAASHEELGMALKASIELFKKVFVHE